MFLHLTSRQILLPHSLIEKNNGLQIINQVVKALTPELKRHGEQNNKNLVNHVKIIIVVSSYNIGTNEKG